LVADPTINLGIDQSESTVLQVRTNAAEYNIQGALTNPQGNDSGLHYSPDGGASHYYIENGSSGENVFGYNMSSTGDADRSFSSSSSNLFTVNQIGQTNNQTHTVHYDLDVDYGVPAGAYQGTITYTAVPTF